MIGAVLYAAVGVVFGVVSARKLDDNPSPHAEDLALIGCWVLLMAAAWPLFALVGAAMGLMWLMGKLATWGKTR